MMTLVPGHKIFHYVYVHYYDKFDIILEYTASLW